MGRTALALLSTENLLHNLSVIKKQVPNSFIIAMVKANAYGHGLRSVSLRVQKQVASLGVASIDEALALRKAGVTTSITLMEGVFEANELLIACAERFHVVFHTIDQITWLEELSFLPMPLTAWIKIDTGMGRLGFSMDEAPDAYARLSAHPSINNPLGLMSHLACAEEEHPLNEQQFENFARLISDKPGLKSMCNSAAIFSFPAHHYDCVRPGLSLYGMSPFPSKTAADLGLKPVMTLQTRLIAVRFMKKGSTIGYGARFTCPEDMRVGVIAMGYGDGYPRCAQDGTPLLVKGIRCQLVGRVSMDMITIDLRECPHAKVNDQVVLWGEGLPVEEIARFTSKSPYEIVTSIQTRVLFQWTQRLV